MASPRVLIAGVVALIITGAACGSNSSSGPTTLGTLVTTSSTTPPATTLPATTTSAATTTSTTTSSSTTTTTTTPPGTQLVLSENGLGTAAFGADADGVVGYVRSILGASTTDSGWVDPSTFGACPGTEVRIVTWNDLSLYFSDQSIVAQGFRHFMSYTYGPPFAAQINPLGLATADGIAVGSTVGALKATYPSVVLNPGDELSGPTFFITEGLFGYLTGTSDADVVTEFVGGFGCGE